MIHEVLQVVTTTDRRGAQVFAAELAPMLAESGHDVRTIALTHGREADGLPITTLGPGPLSPVTLARLRREARDARVVVAHGSTTLPACVAATAGLGRCLVYRNIGDPRYWSSRLDRRLRVRMLLGRVDLVVALWPGAADAMRSLHGVAPSKTRVIPNGAAAARFPFVNASRRASARRELDVDPQAPTAVVLGALSPEKNVGGAIRAVAAVTGLQLVVAGDGRERGDLEALAADVAPGRVRFLGEVAEPGRVLAAADVVVVPSATEGMPGVAIEAGLSGLPVVATDVGGVREIVVDGVTGVVVAPGDAGALARGLRDALAAPDALGAEAHRRCVERFELGVVARQWDVLLGGLSGVAGATACREPEPRRPR